VEQADPGRWGVVAAHAGDQRTTAHVLADHGRIRCLLFGQQVLAGGGPEGGTKDTAMIAASAAVAMTNLS
jgi:hypothetical protein